MDTPKEKARKLRAIERDKLFSFTPEEILSLSHPDQYQRMRYEREVEGNEYVRLLQSDMEREKAIIEARKYSDRIVENWTQYRKLFHVEPLQIEETKRLGHDAG